MLLLNLVDLVACIWLGMLGYGELQVLRQAEQILCSGLQLQPWAQRFDIKFYKTDIVHIELSALLLFFYGLLVVFVRGKKGDASYFEAGSSLLNSATMLQSGHFLNLCLPHTP